MTELHCLYRNVFILTTTLWLKQTQLTPVQEMLINTSPILYAIYCVLLYFINFYNDIYDVHYKTFKWKSVFTTSLHIFSYAFIVVYMSWFI